MITDHRLVEYPNLQRVLIKDIKEHITYACVLLAIIIAAQLLIEPESSFLIVFALIVAGYIAYAISKLVRFYATVDKVLNYVETFRRSNSLREIDNALSVQPLPESVVANGWVFATSYIDGLEFAPIEAIKQLTIVDSRRGFFDLKAQMDDDREFILAYDEERARFILGKIREQRPGIPLDPKAADNFAKIL